MESLAFTVTPFFFQKQEGELNRMTGKMLYYLVRPSKVKTGIFVFTKWGIGPGMAVKIENFFPLFTVTFLT